MNDADRSRAHRTLLRVGAALLVLVLVLAAWRLANVLLLTFAGVLLGVFLRGLAAWLHRWTRLPMTWAVGVVTVLLTTATAAGIVYAWPQVANGVDQLSQDIPQALDALKERVRPPPAVEQWLGDAVENGDGLPLPSGMMQQVLGIFSTLLGAVSGLLIILVNGLYFAFEPGVYRSGLVRLAPLRHRPRAWLVLDKLAHSLRRWLVGRVSSMIVVGLLTYAGLALLGIPSAGLLALMAGLLSFIPNLGPILAAVPAVLAGLSQSPEMALWVAGLYLAVQTVESYLITPLIQRHAVALPPALLLGAQLSMGILFGFLGLLLATPLTVVVLVLVQMLYVQDALGDEEVDLP